MKMILIFIVNELRIYEISGIEKIVDMLRYLFIIEIGNYIHFGPKD